MTSGNKLMPREFDQHKFNDDLLLEQADRDVAARRYPTVFHALDHLELREYFQLFDPSAIRAKRRSRIAGFFAICLGCMALMLAATEHLVDPASDTLPAFVVKNLPASVVSLLPNVSRSTSLATATSLTAISSIAIAGMGLLFARNKRQWLFQRLMTERIRQFHFQTLVFRLPDISASLQDDQARDDFKAKRQEWFEAFKKRMDGKLDSEFAEIVRDDPQVDAWLHEERGEPTEIKESQHLAPLFRAYRELRIMHQIDYANCKLVDDQKLFSGSPPRQAAVLRNAGYACIIVLVVIHFLILIGAVSQALFWTQFRSELSVIVMIVAFTALGVQTLEQGLQPERETERYQQYNIAIRAIRERYDNARSQADKIRVMQEMERAAFDEMRNFMMTFSKARFVM
jgi:hypothetical protein